MEQWKKQAGGQHQDNNTNKHLAQAIKTKKWHLGDLLQRKQKQIKQCVRA
jgi:hypothetical protein